MRLTCDLHRVSIVSIHRSLCVFCATITYNAILMAASDINLVKGN